MTERTGVVVSARVYWQRDDTGRPRRLQRVRVEYPDGSDTRLVTGESRPGREVRTGDRVTVLMRPGRPATIVPTIGKRRPKRGSLRGGLIAVTVLVALVLLLSGGVFIHAMWSRDRYAPLIPPASPDVGPVSPQPSVSGGAGGESSTSGR
jgi:hypothetical protein